MKLVRWTRFTWELGNLPDLKTPLPERYQVRLGARGEEATIASVILSAFALDFALGEALREIRQPLQLHLEAPGEREDVPALVICHGQRIIGASAIVSLEGSDNHLLSGPCVLMEYHNRGLGTALLHYSLAHLKAAGFAQAHAVTKANCVAGRFIYPKFGGTGTDYEIEPVVVAAVREQQ